MRGPSGSIFQREVGYSPKHPILAVLKELLHNSWWISIAYSKWTSLPALCKKRKKEKKSSHFYEAPVVSFKVLRHARGNNVPPYDSETVCKPVGWKIKSNCTLYLKTKFWKRVTKSEIWPFRKQHNTKQNHLHQKPWKMSENKLKQADYQHSHTESEKEYQKERNVFSLPYRILWGLTYLNCYCC